PGEACRGSARTPAGGPKGSGPTTSRRPRESRGAASAASARSRGRVSPVPARSGLSQTPRPPWTNARNPAMLVEGERWHDDDAAACGAAEAQPPNALPGDQDLVANDAGGRPAGIRARDSLTCI